MDECFAILDVYPPLLRVFFFFFWLCAATKEQLRLDSPISEL